MSIDFALLNKTLLFNFLEFKDSLNSFNKSIEEIKPWIGGIQ